MSQQITYMGKRVWPRNPRGEFKGKQSGKIKGSLIIIGFFIAALLAIAIYTQVTYVKARKSTKANSERAELIGMFTDKINAERRGTKYKKLPVRAVADCCDIR